MASRARKGFSWDDLSKPQFSKNDLHGEQQSIRTFPESYNQTNSTIRRRTWIIDFAQLKKLSRLTLQ